MKRVIFCFILLLPIRALSQMPDISFEHISTQKELPSNDVWYATKDKQGFMETKASKITTTTLASFVVSF